MTQSKSLFEAYVVTRVLRISSAVLAVFMCFPLSNAVAQSTNSFPEMPVDARTSRVQNQAEEVFLRGDYERAFFIYRNELTPIGDKYGQYMVGFLYLTGKGIERNVVAASAWYRLAAERGTTQFERARDQLLTQLSEAQLAQSDAMYIDIRRKYGDLAILARAIREDYDELRGRTGSRLGSDTSPVAVVDLGTAGATRSGSEYYSRIERRMKARLEYIIKHTEIGIIDLDSDEIDVDSIERQVASHLGRLP